MKQNYFFMLLSLMLLTTGSVLSQSMSPNTVLPQDENLRKGVLKNGLTYYIYNTDVTKDAVSYYIIQNVGSILENDKQKGLAHFLEHMAFNGSKNFKGKGVLETLEKYGAVFGKDVNAYTLFDETVYNIDDVPNKPEWIDNCLLILHDWCNYLTLSDKEIDAERGVIREEMRLRNSGYMRMANQLMPTVYNEAKYKDRIPIATPKDINTFKYKELRDFYHDWYRTDLQAIAVIGDVNPDEIEVKIKKLFSEIKPIKNPKKRFVVEIPDNKTPEYGLVMDKEVTSSRIAFGMRYKRRLTPTTVADLKEAIESQIAMRLLNTRIKELSKKPDAPFLGGSVSNGKLSRATNQLEIQVFPKPNQQSQAFKTVMDVVVQAVKYGFTKAEIARSITQLKNTYKQQLAEKDERPHYAIASEIQDNYLENRVPQDISKTYDIKNKILDGITPTALKNLLNTLYRKTNRYIAVSGVASDKNLTKTEALDIIQTAENNPEIKPYHDAFSGNTSLISGMDIKPGTIISETTNPELGDTTFKLSNGITIHYKFADKNKNEVNLKALSYGGYSLIDKVDLPSAMVMPQVITESGLGNFSSTDLPKVLAGKNASTSFSISGVNESVSGHSVTKDVETMLQSLYLRFVKPRFDPNALTLIKDRVKIYIESKKKNAQQQQQDSLTAVLYGKHNMLHPILDNDFLEKINFDGVKRVYLDRFKDASDFEFFIVGDVKKSVLKPLLEKYIASIPTKHITENWKTYNDSWVSNKIDKDIFMPMEDPKTSVRIAYRKAMPYSLKNSLEASILGDILKLRYTETLREDQGGVYGSFTTSTLSKRPKSEASLSVYFECSPDRAEELKQLAYNEIEKITQAGGVKQTDLEKIKANYIKERTQRKSYNYHDMNLLTTYYREGYNMDAPENFKNIIDSITVTDIQDFAKKIHDNSATYEILIKPKL